ncbi:hypothetical protein [Streptomyces sp. KL2]|uniref:hypothetical protein n=1 Tax=Streptomyces sp. KL2 TaxID=3050126 RepID=UPI00397985D0
MVIGDRDAPSWVVTARRMAPGRSAAPAGGDEVLLHTTRGCFRNPTRDLGRAMARARVAGPVRSLDGPVRFGERAFSEGCDLRTGCLAPFRADVRRCA